MPPAEALTGLVTVSLASTAFDVGTRFRFSGRAGGPSGMANQQWTVRGGGTMLQSRSEKFSAADPMCLIVVKGAAGGTLSARDDAGHTWLLAGAESTTYSNVVLSGSARAKGLNPQATTWQVLADLHSPGYFSINGHVAR